MSAADIKIEFDQEVYEFLSGSRLSRCMALGCIHNAIYNKDPHGRPECLLKRISITDEGRCRDYELIEVTA